MPNLIDIAKPVFSIPVKVAHTAVGQAGGLVGKLRGGNGQTPHDLNDPTLKSKVESAVYRVPGVSRAKVNVTVADGTVTIHGEAKNTAQMASIQTAARSVPEVRVLESELHLPKTPAPSTSRAGARRSPRKPAAQTKAAAKGRTERVSRDKTAATAAKVHAPTPAEIAATGQGRPPAPFGSSDTPAEGSGRPPAPFGSTDKPAEGSGPPPAPFGSTDKPAEGSGPPPAPFGSSDTPTEGSDS